jgi:hypothetical protein
MLRLLLHWVRRVRGALAARIPIYRMRQLPARAELLRMRFEVESDGTEALARLRARLDQEFDALLQAEGVEGAPAEASP